MWPYNPFFPPFFRPTRRLPRALSTYKVNTTGVQDEGDITDLIIPASVYNSLPNECIVLFNITQGIPTTRAENNVNVLAGTTITRRLTVVDSQNNVVTGTDIPLPTEKQVYLNKSAGTFRILNYLTATTAAAEAATLSAPVAAKSSKSAQ